MLCKLSAFALITAMIGVASSHALAFPDQGSCAGGAPGATATLGAPPPGPTFGTDFASPAARAGQAKQTLELIHTVYCNQQPAQSGNLPN